MMASRIGGYHNMRMVSAFALASVVVGAISSTASAAVFYLNGGYDGLQSSYTFTVDGIQMTVIGGTFSGDTITSCGTCVGQYSNGMGVTSAPGDEHWIDGTVRNDVLIFSFDQEVELEAIGFAYNDYNDDVNLFWGTATGSEQIGEYDLPGYYFYSVLWAPDGYVSDMFGAGADYYNDEFKIWGIAVNAVSEVPLPFSGLLLLGAVGALAGVRRRVT